MRLDPPKPDYWYIYSFFLLAGPDPLNGEELCVIHQTDHDLDRLDNPDPKTHAVFEIESVRYQPRLA